MSLSRLLLAKPVLQCNRRGILTSTRWCSSSSSSSSGKTETKSSHFKVPEVAEDNLAAAAESSMEMHPKAAEVQNKAGRSWYTLKGILGNLKGKILGNPQYQEPISSDISHSKVDSAASEFIMTHTSGRTSESGESKSLRHSSEVPMYSYSSKESASTHTKSHLLGENSSEGAVDGTGSEVLKLHKCPNGIKLSDSESNDQAAEVPKNLHCNETEDVVQSSEATRVPLSDKKTASTSVVSCIRGGNHSGKMVQLEDLSDNSNVVKLENEDRLLEESMFDTVGKSDKNKNKEAEHLFSFTRYLLDGAFGTPQNKNANELTSLRSGKCELEKKTATSFQTLNDGSKVDEIPSSSDDSRKVKGLAELFKKTMNNRTAEEMGHQSSDLLTPSESLSDSVGTLQENVARTFDIESLIGYIKEPPGEPCSVKSQDSAMSNVKDQISSKGSILKIQSQDKSQNSDVERIKTLLSGHAGGKDGKMNMMKEEQIVGISSKTHGGNMTKNEECNSLDVAANHLLELVPSPQVSLSTGKEDINQTHVTCFTEGPLENKVLIRFLSKDVEDCDIISYLRDCGPIVKIRKVSSFEGSNFNDAFVHFKTTEGLQKALEKTEILIKNSTAFMEATSQEAMAHKISIPNLIGDPNIPVALVKHPTRMVKINQLTRDISSHQLKKALSFCGSGITNFFLGTSSATAYVEFETEDAKERALAKHSINVLGKQFLIFRVDVPRTTVVRIHNVDPNCYKLVKSICKSYGKIKMIRCRHTGVVDVHFMIDEWPNMLDILNSLNGLEVGGRRWLAQPAPVFPPSMLQVLWSHPDERKHVKAVMHSLLRTLQHSVNMDELTELAAKQYGEGD